MTHAHPLEKLISERIVIIDGATGTTLRTYGMKEADIRGERFRDSKKDLLNNGDIFCLTQPAMMIDIHRRFLEAGADIIETNTFGATTITQSEFFIDDPREHGGRKDPEFYAKVIEDRFLQDLAWEINVESARQCREAADRVANATGRQRFVAGAIGPLTVSLSNSPDAEDAGFRVATFDQVKAAYVHEVRALIAGGVDVLLVETIFDSLNAKAALVAIQEVFEKDQKRLPVMVSAAVGRGGETMISAQTVEALWNAVEHVKPLSIGLNCSLGPDVMYPFLSELSQKAGVAISCYPNAGLPNPLSETGFDLGPPDMGRFLGQFADSGLVNIAGGCCGNTPEHIAAIATASSYLLSLISFANFGEPATFVRSPIIMKTFSCCVNGSDPDSRSGFVAGSASAGALRTGRGGRPSSAFAIAAMCSSVFPQQPPAMLTRPLSAN